MESVFVWPGRAWAFGMSLLAITPLFSLCHAGTILSIGREPPGPLPVNADQKAALSLFWSDSEAVDPDSLRYELWLVGGDLQTPLRTGPLVFESDNDIDSPPTEFQLQIPDAAPGTRLRLAVFDAQDQMQAETFLRVNEPWNPEKLREWLDRYPVRIDPELTQLVSAFAAWELPHAGAGNGGWLSAPPAVAIRPADHEESVEAPVHILLEEAKGKPLLFRIWQTGERRGAIQARMSDSACLQSDPVARRDFLLLLQEAATLLGPDSLYHFPNLNP